MTFREFGEIVEPAPKDFPQYGKVIEVPSKPRSVAHAFAKGVVKEAADIGELFQKIPLPKGPFNPEKAREFAEEHLPTREGELEKYAERAGRIAPTALLSPGGPLVKGAQVALGAGLGYGAEKLGLPDWAQSLIESAPFLYSGIKKIPTGASQKKFTEFLRKQGLSENEIAPLLKSEKQLHRYGKLASKGEKNEKLMRSLYEKTGSIYEGLKTQGKNLPGLAEADRIGLLNEFTPIIESMPSKYRNLIKEDMLDLLKSEGRFDDLINLYQDINAVIGAEHGGRAIVGRFKQPLINAMEKISPEMAGDFRLANDLFRTRKNVASKLLSRNQVDSLVDLGEIYGLGAGIANADLGLLTKVIGAAGGRNLAREMLINPRLTNKARRIGDALKKNKLFLARELIGNFKEEISKDNPELAKTIDFQESSSTR